jgi:2-polyprenyl-6-methoxyphenol hydroxylase-like FAD-dependent oxidoreductase
MARIVVLGGSVIGLSVAMMLKRLGHDVTVFERDSDPVPRSPEDAWERWERQGVAQFRQPHYLHPAARQILDAHLPEVTEALLQAGGVRFDVCEQLMPPSIADRSKRGDDGRFVTVTGRRPVVKYAVASTAEKRVPIERGVSVTGLLTGAMTSEEVPHVTGIRTMGGDEALADLVIDAMGRRSKLPEWLQAIGARSPLEETEEIGFIYYTRYFRSKGGVRPSYRSGLLTHYHSFSLLALPGDAETWSVTVFLFSGDPALKALRDSRRWTALVRACPLHAHWLDAEPVTDVLAMGGISERHRRFVVDGIPIATGIISVGDSWACTNPVGGRGISMGLMHAAGTTEVIQAHLDDPAELALAHAAMTETRVTPWYQDTVAFDRQRAAQFKAVMQGRSAPSSTDSGSALANAMRYDADLFRAFIEIQSLLALPQEVMARPGVAERVRTVASLREPVDPPGPSRDEVVRILA